LLFHCPLTVVQATLKTKIFVQDIEHHRNYLKRVELSNFSVKLA